MDIGPLRDLIIIIGGFLVLVLFVLTAILGFFLYCSVKTLTVNTRGTLNTAKQTFSDTGQAVRSFKDLINIFQGKKTGEKSEKTV